MSNNKRKEKNNKQKNNNKKEIKYELIALLILTITILLLISFLGLGGPAGKLFKDVFYGFMGGVTSWIAVVYICYNSLVPFGRKSEDRIKKTLSGILLTISVSSFAAVFTKLSSDDNLIDFINKSINSEKIVSGGIVGGFFSYLLKVAFSEIGAIIIITAILLVAIILITQYSLRQGFIKLAKLFKVKSREKEDDSEDFMPINTSVPLRASNKFTDVAPYDKNEGKIKFKGFKEAAPSGEDEDYNSKNSYDIPVSTSLEPQGKPLDPDSVMPGNISFDYNDTYETGAFNNIKEDENKKRARNIEAANETGNNIKNIGFENEGDKSFDKENEEGVAKEYIFPSYNFLKDNKAGNIDSKNAKVQVQADAKRLEETLRSFGVEARVINICRGPVVTRYELQPNTGVKINKIVNLSDDLAMNLAAKAIRIEAPIPGKSAIGIEIPNKEAQPVFIKDVLVTEEFTKEKSKLAIALGKDVTGEIILADISKMPHLLIAGATGSGKSVCINSIIISLLYKANPSELKVIMIDPKVVELNVYNGIPHLEIPVVTDPRKAAGALQWAVREMENRYKLFAEVGARDLSGYNMIVGKKEPEAVLPHFVIIVDELADLMMVAPGEIEGNICRLAQMARAAGMHLIIATQRPSVDVITGVIKANIPSRIAFKVSSQFDSRTILDKGGAEKLLGRGDMLFCPMGANEPIRVQGAFISDSEVENIIGFIKKQGSAEYNEDVMEEIEKANINTGRKKNSYGGDDGNNDDREKDNRDPKLYEAIEIVIRDNKPSASYLQRKLQLGYSRAARLIDQMEDMGIVSGMDGSNSRKVIITNEQFYEMKMRMTEEG